MKSAVKRIKGLLWALMYVALYYAVSFCVYNIYFLWLVKAAVYSLPDAERTAINNSYFLTAITWIICLWLYVLIGKLRKNPVRKMIKEKTDPPIIYLMAAVLAIGCRLLVVVYYSLAQKADFLNRSIENAMNTSPEITTLGQGLMAVFCIVLIAPFFEELLFRVLVMGELMKIMRPWAAILLQGVAFGVVHGAIYQSLFAFAIGVILGVIYYKTQNIKVVTTSHAMFNFSAFLMQDELTLRGTLVFILTGILLLSLSFFYIVAYTKRKE